MSINDFDLIYEKRPNKGKEKPPFDKGCPGKTRIFRDEYGEQGRIVLPHITDGVLPERDDEPY